jgi:hypothetical protein
LIVKGLAMNRKYTLTAFRPKGTIVKEYPRLNIKGRVAHLVFVLSPNDKKHEILNKIHPLKTVNISCG